MLRNVNHFNKSNHFNKFNSQNVPTPKEWIIYWLIIEYSDVIR